ncbi:MAG: hypothetical protein ACREH4_14015 [Vitreimonas sp.]
MLGSLAIGVLPLAVFGRGQGSNTTLRVIFDSIDNSARVTRIRVGGEGENFRPGRDSHELTGNMQQVRWRAGNAVRECPAGG